MSSSKFPTVIIPTLVGLVIFAGKTMKPRHLWQPCLVPSQRENNQIAKFGKTNMLKGTTVIASPHFFRNDNFLPEVAKNRPGASPHANALLPRDFGLSNLRYKKGLLPIYKPVTTPPPPGAKKSTHPLARVYESNILAMFRTCVSAPTMATNSALDYLLLVDVDILVDSTSPIAVIQKAVQSDRLKTIIIVI